MTARYFYTDPLSAAWVADKYGVKFEGGYFSGHDGFEYDVTLCHTEIQERYYIAGESSSLLELGIGDFVKVIYGNDNYGIEKVNDLSEDYVSINIEEAKNNGYKNHPAQRHRIRVAGE